MKKKQLAQLQNEYGVRKWDHPKGEYSEYYIPYNECRTPGLLALLQSARAKHSELGNRIAELVKKQEELNGIMHRLKTELATREHIPNKQEKKEIRRKKAQGKCVVD